MWFRQDLRLVDNPAWRHAAETGKRVLPLYILDDDNSGRWKPGAASRWWLHESLRALNADLKGHLCFAQGDALAVLEDLVRQLTKQRPVAGVYWNKCYEPWRVKRDEAIERSLIRQRVAVETFNGALLFEPHQALKDDGSPYQVFTPFYKNGYLHRPVPPLAPCGAPKKPTLFKHALVALDDLLLMPDKPWCQGIQQAWTPGEDNAKRRLAAYVSQGLADYTNKRDYPACNSVSLLSPHLHFGELSPNQVWHAIRNNTPGKIPEEVAEGFLRQLVWREFSYHLLHHRPEMPDRNLHKRYNAFPWGDNKALLKKWQHGQTGYPIVDAGMRELWQTGYMHNRVRMLVASFLTKNLLIHWRHGARWFWDTLVDADLANNSNGWQWVAGCGVDAAAPYRIFNPVLQAQRFDADGAYVRRYVPELAALPDKFIHRPWEAPADILTEAKIKLGTTYPHPVVDLVSSRERAKKIYKEVLQRRADRLS